jgi:hypothetical protein
VRVGGAVVGGGSPARGGVAAHQLQQQQLQHNNVSSPIRVTMRDINIKAKESASATSYLFSFIGIPFVF